MCRAKPDILSFEPHGLCGSTSFGKIDRQVVHRQSDRGLAGSVMATWAIVKKPELGASSKVQRIRDKLGSSFSRLGVGNVRTRVLGRGDYWPGTLGSFASQHRIPIQQNMYSLWLLPNQLAVKHEVLSVA